MPGVPCNFTNAYPMPVLTEARIRAAKPKERAYKLFDERGLYMPLPHRAGSDGDSGIGSMG
jgi:hypothetical protein